MRLKNSDRKLDILLWTRFIVLVIAMFGIQISIAAANVGYILALILSFVIHRSRNSNLLMNSKPVSNSILNRWNPFSSIGIEYALIGLAVTAVISAVLPNPASPWGTLNEETLILALFTVAAGCPNQLVLRYLMTAAIVGAVLVSLSAAYGWISSPEGFVIDNSLGSGREIHHLTVGGTLLVAASAVLGLTASSISGKYRTIWSISLIIICIGLFLSMARGAWVGFALALTLCASLKGLRYLVIPVALGCIFLLVNPVVGRVTAREHVMSIVNRTGGGDRAYIWGSALSMIREYPWFGAGPNSFGHYFPIHVDPEFKGQQFDHAHNNILHRFAERGIFGLITRLWLTLSLWLILFKRYRYLEKKSLTDKNIHSATGSGAVLGALLALTAVEGMGLTQNTWGDWEVMLSLWMIIGAAVGSTEYFSRSALLMDRDGTVNVENGFCTKPEELTIIPGAIEALSRLQEHYILFLVTNQSGIGRGLLNLETLKKIQSRMDKMMTEKGVVIKEVFYCPHKPDDNCRCRKPLKAILMPWLLGTDIDLSDSWVIGDRSSDLGLAYNLDIKACLVLTGHGEKHRDTEEGKSANLILEDITQLPDSLIKESSLNG